MSSGRPDIVDTSSAHRPVESVTTWSMASTSSTMTDRQPLPPALLRVTSSRTDAERTTASSTPRGRALALRAILGPDRPDSALSNFSELDSGYDELRSFTVTPVIPPELVITGPQDDEPDLLPPEMTSSSSVDNEARDKVGKQDDENGFEDNKSISEESDLGQSAAFPEDRCNTSSMIEQEDLLSVNTGTGNSSAMSLPSLDGAESCRVSANNSECEALSLCFAVFSIISFVSSF